MKSFEIRTRRLVLRPLGVKYLHTVHEYASDYENTKYMVHLPNERFEDTLAFLQNIEQEWEKDDPEFYEFAVCMEDKHIGAVSVYLDENKRSGELGWIINKRYWGQGIALEAAEALINFASDKLNIHHFIAHCDSENIGSYKVMEKIGMIRTDTYGGRKNKSSDEERIELKYEMDVCIFPNTCSAREFTKDDKEQLLNMKEEIDNCDRNFEGFDIFRNIENYDEFLTDLERKKHQELIKQTHSPQTVYGFFIDDKLAGGFIIRHTLKGTLINHGGNIGYLIRPSERRKGYGTVMLKYALMKAKEIGLDKALVSCRAENLASAKVIENNGGIYENNYYDASTGKTFKRYWINL